MNMLRLRFLPSLLVAIAAGLALGQQDDRAPFRSRDGYEEARLGGGAVTIKTRDGTKTIHVGLAKLRVSQTGRTATIRLPGAGLALLQHAAGAVKVGVGQQSFEPLEGEWLRLPLPAEFTLGTNADTVQLDLIVIEER